MSTRCYDTDLNAAAWPGSPRTCRQSGRVGSPRTSDLRAVLNQRALHEQARLKPRPLALPFGGHPGQSVGQDCRARRHPRFRWAQTGQRAQTPPARGYPGDGGGPSGRSRQCVGPTRGGAAALPAYNPTSRGSGRARLRALSVRQPWAWLIVNGVKDIENRSFRTDHHGPLLIHAALSLDGYTENIKWVK